MNPCKYQIVITKDDHRRHNFVARTDRPVPIGVRHVKIIDLQFPPERDE